MTAGQTPDPAAERHSKAMARLDALTEWARQPKALTNEFLADLEAAAIEERRAYAALMGSPE